jgi:hypothetical protein
MKSGRPAVGILIPGAHKAAVAATAPYLITNPGCGIAKRAFSIATAAAIFSICALSAFDRAFALVPAGTKYTFTRVATTTVELQSLLSQEPQINSDGAALFTGRLPNNVEALLLGNGSTLKTVTSWTEAPRVGIDGSALGAQQMNDGGDVVFRGGPGGSEEHIYLWRDGAALVSLYGSIGPSGTTFRFSFEPSINNRGDVAFVGSGQSLPSAVFVGDRNGRFPTTALASTGGALWEGFTYFNQPHLTSDGAVILAAYKGDEHGVYRLRSRTKITYSISAWGEIV